jgi:hypothetical protein
LETVHEAQTQSPFFSGRPPFPPALNPIYTLDQVLFLFYTFPSRKRPIIGSESGSRKRRGYVGQGERGWKMEAKKRRRHE